VTPSSNIAGTWKVAVCIKEMAGMCGFSRQRFMQLVKSGVMPAPLRDEETGRPFFTEEMQAQCLEIRRRGMGRNGKIIMFYCRRTPTPAAPGRPKVLKAKDTKVGGDQYVEIVDGLHGLGLMTVTAEQVGKTVAILYPQGTSGLDNGEVIRRAFLQLKGKNSAENVGGK
jgi:hypothetical protein